MSLVKEFHDIVKETWRSRTVITEALRGIPTSVLFSLAFLWLIGYSYYSGALHFSPESLKVNLLKSPSIIEPFKYGTLSLRTLVASSTTWSGGASLMLFACFGLIVQISITISRKIVSPLTYLKNFSEKAEEEREGGIKSMIELFKLDNGIADFFLGLLGKMLGASYLLFVLDLTLVTLLLIYTFLTALVLIASEFFSTEWLVNSCIKLHELTPQLVSATSVEDCSSIISPTFPIAVVALAIWSWISFRFGYGFRSFRFLSLVCNCALILLYSASFGMEDGTKEIKLWSVNLVARESVKIDEIAGDWFLIREYPETVHVYEKESKSSVLFLKNQDLVVLYEDKVDLSDIVTRSSGSKIRSIRSIE